MNAIDLSSFTLRSVVDLTPGAPSTFGYTHHIDDNTAIAFGTTIENVFSGSGADDVFGNDADNEIHAGAGDDLITGGAGNDTLLSQADSGDLTINVSNIAYLGACGSADFCSNAADYAFTSTGRIPDGTTATGRVLGGIFGPNGENAGVLLDASSRYG